MLLTKGKAAQKGKSRKIKETNDNILPMTNCLRGHQKTSLLYNIFSYDSKDGEVKETKDTEDLKAEINSSDELSKEKEKGNMNIVIIQ